MCTAEPAQPTHLDWLRDVARIMWDRLKTALQTLDSEVAARAARSERIARMRGVRRNADWMATRPATSVAEQLRTQGAITDADMAQVTADLLDPATQAATVNRYKRSMNRGPGGMGKMGLIEGANHLIANEAWARRGALPAAVAGGAVAGGAALTEGAQQLMALMGFMQQGREQQERTAESPLT